MPADKRSPENAPKPEDRRVVKGPWEQPAPKAVRIPVFKRRGSMRTPIINNWGGLVAVILLIFAAPPLIGWISRFIMGFLHGGS